MDGKFNFVAGASVATTRTAGAAIEASGIMTFF